MGRERTGGFRGDNLPKRTFHSPALNCATFCRCTATATAERREALRLNVCCDITTRQTLQDKPLGLREKERFTFKFLIDAHNNQGEDE